MPQSQRHSMTNNQVGSDQMDFIKMGILFIWKVGSKQGRGLMGWEMPFQEYEINKEPVSAKPHTWETGRQDVGS